MKTTIKRVPKILKAQQQLRELEIQKFTDKDLRGLSAKEKQFIIDNDYNICLKQRSTICQYDRTIYMFIARNMLGKKQLYAMNKRQLINPNGKDIVVNSCIYNYECWLVFDYKYGEFTRFNFERRFCKVPPIRLIFL